MRVGIFFVITSVVLIVFFLFRPIQREVFVSDISISITPTPTSYPFSELTIPYLREREYASILGDKTVAYKGTNYTAYITSYVSDGLKIYGLLTVPDKETPEKGWPAIVFVHGYIPPLSYKTTQNYYEYVDYLAKQGFVVFKIDLRGHGSSEGEPGGAYYSADYVIDTLNARAALEVSGLVNPKGIGLWGHSMAGNIIMRSAVVRPEISAIVIWAGAGYSYIDQRTYGINDSSYQPSQNPRRNMRQQIAAIHGDPESGSVFWREMAPTNFLDDMEGAIQIHHAVDDAVVNIGYSRDLVDLLDDTKVVHDLREYVKGGHNISGVTFGIAMGETAKFFQTYLP